MPSHRVLHRSWNGLRVVAAAVAFLIVSIVRLDAQAAGISTGVERYRQPSPGAAAFVLPIPGADSSAKKCMDVGWLAPEAVCSGRIQNAFALALMGASFGALDGAVGGWAINTSCIGDYERAATRGAIAGAGVGALLGLLVPHISQREQAERAARERSARESHAPKPWSWNDVKPLVIVGGSVAATGAAIGAIQGARRPATCSGGAAGGAGAGAAVYGSGFAIGVTGLLLGVRLLF